jgi:disulfide bond formation protein DsbB
MSAMSLSAIERFLSLLALVAGAGAVAIVVMRLTPSGRPILALMGQTGRWLAFAIAATAMLGSLWFSEVEKFAPCKLCWYQRICMYSAAIVLLVGALRRDPKVRWYVVPLAGIGICVSIYHYLLEWYPQLETSACDISTPCTAIWYREFGFVTLSFSALCGFAAILALMLFTSDDGHLEDPHDQQTIPTDDVEV